jgi:alpha-galactosidase
VPACGKRPLAFSAEGLPEGLRMEATTGFITGSLMKSGERDVLLKASNSEGRDERKLRIVVGGRLALTPPMGWMTWYCWGSRHIDQTKTLAAADAMVSSGLAAHGFNHIFVDDGWQGERGGLLNALQPNERFPDMKGLVDHVHALGLKAGIYSSPWTQTFAGFNGSTSGRKLRGTPRCADERPGRWIGKKAHIRADVRQWAEWGFDYLKYDWDNWEVRDVEAVAAAIRATGRDMALSLSNHAPFQRASEWARLANLWRTTGDANGTWQQTAAIGFNQDKWTLYAGPGHWNDLDCLMVDVVSWGKPARAKEMSPDEQVAQVTLWALLASPLVLGCDLTRIKDLTLQLLCNPEVLAVDQDPLGRPAHTVTELRNTNQAGLTVRHSHVFKRGLSDGSVAVGLFNRADRPDRVEATWKDLKLRGHRRVRDLWARRDLGNETERLSFRLPPHGVKFLRLSR